MAATSPGNQCTVPLVLGRDKIIKLSLQRVAGIVNSLRE